MNRNIDVSWTTFRSIVLQLFSTYQFVCVLTMGLIPRDKICFRVIHEQEVIFFTYSGRNQIFRKLIFLCHSQGITYKTDLMNNLYSWGLKKIIHTCYRLSNLCQISYGARNTNVAELFTGICFRLRMESKEIEKIGKST